MDGGDAFATARFMASSRVAGETKSALGVSDALEHQGNILAKIPPASKGVALPIHVSMVGQGRGQDGRH